MLEERHHHLRSREVENLIEEGKLLRVLRPDLQRSIESALSSHNGNDNPYVLKNGREIYLCFRHIDNEQRRKRIYRLVQQYQTGEPIDLTSLPLALRQIIQPELTPVGRFIGALIGGAFIGVLIGVLAMAMGVPIIAALELTTGRVLAETHSIQMSAVIFVIFSVIGWMVGTIFAWFRIPPPTPPPPDKSRYRRDL